MIIVANTLWITNVTGNLVTARHFVNICQNNLEYNSNHLVTIILIVTCTLWITNVTGNLVTW